MKYYVRKLGQRKKHECIIIEHIDHEDPQRSYKRIVTPPECELREGDSWFVYTELEPGDEGWQKPRSERKKIEA